MTASSSRGHPYRPANGRLNRIETYGHSAGAWCAGRSKKHDTHWLQVDLGRRFLISKVSLQGILYFFILQRFSLATIIKKENVLLL